MVEMVKGVEKSVVLGKKGYIELLLFSQYIVNGKILLKGRSIVK